MVKSNREEVIKTIRSLDIVFIQLPCGGLSYRLRGGGEVALKTKDNNYFLKAYR